MKRVLLLGDSIRLGYERTVRELLAGEAFVISPPENSEHTIKLLCHFWPWVAQHQPDVVHVNAGLWDTRRVAPEDPATLVPLSIYPENVERLFRLIRTHTSATIIWATTTPIHQATYDREARRNGSAGRSAESIREFNRAAVKVARQQGVPVNDLYALVRRAGKARWLSDDGIHLTPAGYEQLGRAVARAIRKSLLPPHTHSRPAPSFLSHETPHPPPEPRAPAPSLARSRR